MASLDVKEELHSYLRGARETLVWKLAGLLKGVDNLHISDPAEQQRFHDQVEAAAAQFQ
jgi:hypothetical protein